MLLGIPPDGNSLLPREMIKRIIYRNHVRLIRDDAGTIRDDLMNVGLFEMSLDAWTKAPTKVTPEQHIRRMDRILETTNHPGELPNLLLLNPLSSVTYYRGRWKLVAAESGRYVARRPQAYGADLWCYVNLVAGRPVKAIDLPLQEGTRGCDEAWRLQMAIDAARGKPQMVRVSRRSENQQLLEFFGPVPAWARRRWETTGREAEAEGSLFCYEFYNDDFDEALSLARDHLWLVTMQ